MAGQRGPVPPSGGVLPVNPCQLAGFAPDDPRRAVSHHRPLAGEARKCVVLRRTAGVSRQPARDWSPSTSSTWCTGFRFFTAVIGCESLGFSGGAGHLELVLRGGLARSSTTQMLLRSNALVQLLFFRRLVSDTPRPVRLCGPQSQLVSPTNRALYPQLIDRFTCRFLAR